MMKEFIDVYLPMPVSFDVKREWNSKGYRVLDAAFAPEGYELPADDKTKAKGAKNAKTENASS